VGSCVDVATPIVCNGEPRFGGCIDCDCVKECRLGLCNGEHGLDMRMHRCVVCKCDLKM